MKATPTTAHRTLLLYRFSWTLVAYTILIVVWGAWVRISGSGDGCGDHWPLCNGAVVPLQARTKTWIEYSHRLSTGLYGVLVILQIIWVRRLWPAAHPARAWSAYTLLFTITEALIGRQLVTMGLVNQSVAVERVIVMPLHLVNTALLLGAAVMTAEAIRFGDTPRTPLSPALRRYLSALIAALLLLLTTGAVAALGAHLAPSSSIASGITQDLSSNSHIAVRLRILHPILALVGPLILWWVLERLREHAPSRTAKVLFTRLSLALLLAVVVGILTLLSLAPVWLKVTHLALANFLVVLTTLCVFHSLRPTCSQG